MRSKPGDAVAEVASEEFVQVHPTGLVKPDDAYAKFKFLAVRRHVAAMTLAADITSQDEFWGHEVLSDTVVQIFAFH